MGHKLIKIYLYSIVLLVLGLIISVSGSISSSLAYADDSSAVDSFNLSLPVSCTIGSSGGNHTQSIINNQYYGNYGLLWRFVSKDYLFDLHNSKIIVIFAAIKP